MICLVALYMASSQAPTVVKVNHDFIVALAPEKKPKLNPMTQEQGHTYISLSAGEQDGLWVKGSVSYVQRQIDLQCSDAAVAYKNRQVIEERVRRKGGIATKE